MIHNLDALFSGVLAAYPFRVTQRRRSALPQRGKRPTMLLEMINEEAASSAARLYASKLAPNMPDDMLGLLRNEQGWRWMTYTPCVGRCVWPICSCWPISNLPHLKYEAWTPYAPALPVLTGRRAPARCFSIIRQGDLLVHHPYHGFGQHPAVHRGRRPRSPSTRHQADALPYQRRLAGRSCADPGGGSAANKSPSSSRSSALRRSAEHRVGARAEAPAATSPTLGRP